MATENKNITANLTLENDNIKLPIYKATLGQDVIDVTSIIKHNKFTFDPGFSSTASCESKITYIDGDNGILLYRGYPIEQLAEKSSYLETCYLLLNGELPNSGELEVFNNEINDLALLNEQLSGVTAGFRHDAHPMSIVLSTVSALASVHHDKLDIKNQDHRIFTAKNLIAKIPTISAMAYRFSIDESYVYPQDHFNYTENFLNMMFSKPNKDYEPNPVVAKALDKIFILHADHEQNASTSTVRLAGSTGTNPYAAIASGIAALWGPAHGGANEAVIKMLNQIGHEDNIEKFINKAKDKNDSFRLMGFGHRVYKNFDPRANIMRSTCYEVLDSLDQGDNQLFKIALKLEKIALEDEYFVKRKLYPNVDFYSGIILQAMGIPTNMFTVLFALARTSGWISHWNEMLSMPGRIGRPRQLYTGYEKRNYLDTEKK